MSLQPTAKKIILASAVFGAAALFVAFYRRSQAKSKKCSTSTAARVVDMWVFPVKSCSGMRITSAALFDTGLEYDRQWAVVRRSDSKVMTMRELPVMKKITASVEGKSLVMSFPGRGSVSIPLDWSSGNEVEVPIAVWGIEGSVKAFGDASVQSWLSSILNDGCSTSSASEYFLSSIRALRDPGGDENGKHRKVVPQNQKIKMHDFSTLHIISLSSVASLRDAVGDPSIDVLRFRANVIVDGCDSYDEDTWDEFTVGGVPMRTARLCGRCAIPTINDDGERNKAFLPTAYLRQARFVRYTHRPPTDPPQAMFGIAVFQQGPLAQAGSIAPTIRVGDAVFVASRREPPVLVTEPVQA